MTSGSAFISNARPPRLDRRRYLVWGLALFAVKFAIDNAFSLWLFDQRWTLFDYLIPLRLMDVSMMSSAELARYGIMLAVAAPFVTAGVVLTVRRLRDAGLPAWLAMLFFLPLINLIFLAVLCVLPTARAPDPAPGPPMDATTTEAAAVPFARLAPPSAFASDIEAVNYAIDDTRRPETWISRFFPDHAVASGAVAVLVPTPLIVGFTMLNVFAMHNYGWMLFIGMPFFLGMLSASLHGVRRVRGIGSCLAVGAVSMVVSGVVLFSLAIEGAGCLIMCLPITCPIALIGAAVGYAVQARTSRPRCAGVGRAFGLLAILFPPAALIERVARPTAPVYAVTTSIEVNAPPRDVWRHVVHFPDLPGPPDGWAFRMGVAYPIRARIDGVGPGAVRECVFSTGAFVEPITVWDEPRLLRFSVTKCPPAMREVSPYADINPPHVHDFLVARQGEFSLVDLGDGRTRIDGTTWYQHNMWPAGYWHVWSDHILHQIHGTVLAHVKELSERDAMAQVAAPGARR